VTTDNWGSNVAGYQSVTEAWSPANLGLQIRDLTLAGYDDTGTDYADQMGVVGGEVQLSNLPSGGITNVANTTPIGITTSAEEPRTGQRVKITGTGVMAIDNNTYTVTRTGDGTFTLNGTAASGTSSSGTWTRQDLYTLLRLQSSGADVENVRFFYCPGVCLDVVGLSGGTQAGPKRMFDAEVVHIQNIRFKRAYRFIDVKQVDVAISGVEGEKWGDYAIKIDKLAGGVKIRGPIHLYGGGGPCIWLDADGTNFASGCVLDGPLYLENAQYGLLISGLRNAVDGLYSHTCTDASVYVTGWAGENSLSNLVIEMNHPTSQQPIGIWNEGYKTSISICMIYNRNINGASGTVGLKLGNDTPTVQRDHQNIRGLRYIGKEPNDSRPLYFLFGHDTDLPG
jgi:hypothetical protein